MTARRRPIKAVVRDPGGSRAGTAPDRRPAIMRVIGEPGRGALTPKPAIAIIGDGPPKPAGRASAAPAEAAAGLS